MSQAMSSDPHQNNTSKRRRRRRRAEGPPHVPGAADVQSLRATLDRGREDNIIKYRSSITSILGDIVDSGIFRGDCAAVASILDGEHDSLSRKGADNGGSGSAHDDVAESHGSALANEE